MTPRRSNGGARPNVRADIALRIVVVDPPPRVRWAVQLGRSDLLEPTRTVDASLAFDFQVRVADESGASGSPRLLGPAIQGPPKARFVYVNSGKRAGDAASCWDRRAKVPLGGITAGLVTDALATPGAVLEARIAGTGRDGGPICASVPLLAEGWRLVAQSQRSG